VGFPPLEEMNLNLVVKEAREGNHLREQGMRALKETSQWWVISDPLAFLAQGEHLHLLQQLNVKALLWETVWKWHGCCLSMDYLLEEKVEGQARLLVYGLLVELQRIEFLAFL
jgi:hypothetical protein